MLQLFFNQNKERKEIMLDKWNDDINKRYTNHSILDFIVRSMTYTSLIDYTEFLKPEYDGFHSLQTSHHRNKNGVLVKGTMETILIPNHCINEDESVKMRSIKMGFIYDLLSTRNIYIPHVDVIAIHLQTKDLLAIDYTIDNMNIFNKKSPNSYTQVDIGRMLDKRNEILQIMKNLITKPYEMLKEDNHGKDS